MMSPPKEIKRLGRFLTYVLGRQPDEFGLVPDEQGFVATKELLKALHQEAGWRNLRMTQFNQLIAMHHPAPIEIVDQLIRATVRNRLPRIIDPKHLPKLLYVAIRRRAYGSVLTKGLSAGNRPYLILSADRAMAQKMGTRLDNRPVVLTIQVAASQAKGTTYQQYGETLYLADTIAAGTFTGPPPPKEKTPPAPKVPEKSPEAAKTPGSYFLELDLTSEEKKALNRERRHRKMAQEKARRQARKYKSKGRP